MAERAYISNILIDLSSWSAGEIKHDSYAYTATVVLSEGGKKNYSTRQITSDGMGNLLSELYAKHGVLPIRNTSVDVLCPRELLKNTDSPYGGMTSNTIEAICKHGTKALAFDVTSDYNFDARFESVLDTAIHFSYKNPYSTKLRRVSLPKSIYHYDKIDNEVTPGKIAAKDAPSNLRI